MVIEIEKLEKVSPERVEFVEECLVDIGRLDLAKKVSAYKMSGETVFVFKGELQLFQPKCCWYIF